MSRYIDADKLLNPDNIIVMQDETGIDEVPYTYTNAVKVETILNAPTADVVEVRHGEWYKHDKKKHGDTCYYCTVCEKMALADWMIWELTDYCPHCGAKMKGE